MKMPTASVMTILGYLSIIETVEKGSLLLWNDENDFPEVKHQLLMISSYDDTWLT